MPNNTNSSDPMADMSLESLTVPSARLQGMRRRLILSTGATALGPLVSLVLQIVSVPIFLRFWGPELYGEWLVLSAIPMYLAMSDLGFGTVASNDITMRAARGDIKGAVVTFQSTWRLITLVSVVLATILVPLLISLPVSKWVRLKQISSSDAHAVLIILVIDSLACLQTSMSVAGFNAAGLNHYSGICANLIRVTEGAAVLLAVIFHRGPVCVASLLLLVRGVGNLGVAFFAARAISWLEFGFRYASWEKVRELSAPALAYLAFPAANSLTIQGSIILIGITLGPLAVSVFAPLRTMARTVMQLSEILKLSAWPELSAAYGAHSFALARKLHRFICQLSLLLSCCAASVLCIVGPWILHIWTHGRIAIDLPTFYLLVADVVINSLWNTSAAVPFAANQHSRIALQQFASTAVAMILSAILMRFMHLAGAAAGLLIGDVIMVFTVLPVSISLLGDHMGDFFRSMLDWRTSIDRLLRRQKGKELLTED